MTQISENQIAKADGSQPTSLDDLFGGRAKAWVNFNGISTTTIRDSQGVSSLTDTGTGVTEVNFATAMGGANYSCQVSAGATGQRADADLGGTAFLTASKCTIAVYATASGILGDPEIGCVTVHGDF